MDNDEEEINDLIQYKRLVYKLEDELKKKSSENSLILKLNEDLKVLYQNVQNECEELNKKLLFQYSEIKKLNKTHQEEIKKINSNHNKQIQIYEEKMQKLSEFNPLNQKIKIEKEVEMRYEEKIKTKVAEIEILNNKINRLSKDNNELQLEIDNLKIKNKKQLKIEKEKEKEENNNILNIINNQNQNEEKNDEENNNKILKELQDIIRNKDDKISELFNELNKIKNEKKDYEINISKKYFFNINELKDEQNKRAFLETKLNEKEKEIKNIYVKLTNLQKIVNEREDEIIILKEEKNKLIQDYENLKNDDTEFEETQKQIEELRNLVQKYESNMQIYKLENEHLKKQNEQKNNKINQIQKEIEEEKSKHINNTNINESNQIKTNNENIKENDINQIKKENDDKNKIIKYDIDSNIFKIEYENMKDKYDLLLADKKIIEQKYKKKEEENEFLNKCVNEMIKKKKERKINLKELKYKYKNLLTKKEHYKELCKIANTNVENIIKLLTPQQLEQIKQSDKKYLIDTDSFSFSEFY